MWIINSGGVISSLGQLGVGLAPAQNSLLSYLTLTGTKSKKHDNQTKKERRVKAEDILCVRTCDPHQDRQRKALIIVAEL